MSNAAQIGLGLAALGRPGYLNVGHGYDVGADHSRESLVVTEDDHIDYPGPGDLEAVIPVTLTARLRRSHFLFLGYDLADWNLRLIAARLRGEHAGAYASWAVCAAPSALELDFWRRLDVQAVEVDENAFASLLDGRLDGVEAT